MSFKNRRQSELNILFIMTKLLQRIFADISYMIDDYPIPFAIFALGMALVTHHYSGSWHSYVPNN